ncbi:hypothetical protein L1987_78543 [Smallanthus sonchifolius]|uniref:Uncharacterized protein n=1 Tax=Smallanthus sonchifolius TaxID=185202 RepID=A0ACB8ZE04_9ASTR|nr:hypothetical protein L1987_78543 [Smallanthus sonchifolius]
MPEAPRKTKIPTSHGYGGRFTNCTRKGSMSFKDVLTGDRGMDKAIKKTLVLDDKWSGFENLYGRSLVPRAASFEVHKNIKTFVAMMWRKKTFMVWVSEDAGDWEADFLRAGKKDTHASTKEEDRTELGSRVATNASPEIGQDDGIVSPEKDMEEDHLASDNEVENNYEMGLNNSRRIESNGETHITPSGESTDVSWDLNCEPALVGDRAQSKEERPVRPDISQSSRSVGSESETCEV